MKVEIEKLDHFGRGIAYINNKICFIENALPKEIVKVKIIKETKKYLLGEVVDFYRLSDDRIEEMCPYVSSCGGCNLEHMSNDCENVFKCNKVREILKKFANIDEKKVLDTVSCNDYYYRNKVTLHAKDNMIGYYEKRSNKVINIEGCLLADSRINEIIEVLNEMALENDFDEVLIRVSNDSSEVMVSISGEVDDYSILVNRVDTLIINDEVILGEGNIISSIGNKKYYVSSKSFFQVNKDLTSKLYDEVLNVVKEVKPKKVLDLYCGAGTIGIYISDYVEKVIGVDYSMSGIVDAKNNNDLNGSNVEFICDRVENVIDGFDDIDLVIVDPPRSGLDNKTIENICRIGAEKVIYISCDPVTLARDLKSLSKNYDVSCVKPYNMFPRTYHVESISVLERKSVEK